MAVSASALMAVFMETEDSSSSHVKTSVPGQFGVSYVNTSNSKAAKSDKQKVMKIEMK